MNKKLFSIILGVTLVAAAAIPSVVLAANNAEQSASTLQATTISIKGQDGATSDITAITFPAAACGATVDNPSNSESEMQEFGGAEVAKPVVTLVSPADYTVWLQVENFSSNVVDSEYYALLDHQAACLDADAVSSEITLNDTAFTTEVSMTTAEINDLYLKVTLGSVAGRTGFSSISILGEKE